MKLTTILHLLSETEKSEVQDIVIEKGRDSLSNLWMSLKQDKFAGEESKEILYQYIFGEPYSKDKDYLLRNEQRILTALLTDFIGKSETIAAIENDEIKASIKVLERMIRLGITDDFEVIWSDVFRNATKKKLYGEMATLMDLKASWRIKSKEVSVKNYEQVRIEMQLQSVYIQKENTEKVKRLEVGDAFTSRVIRSLGMLDSKAKAKEEKDDFFTDLIAYYHQLSESYSLDGYDKIKKLEGLINLHKRLAVYRPILEKDKVTILGNIGLSYFLMDEYEKAHLYYTLLIEGVKNNNVNIDILFNYCVNLLMLERYKLFIKNYNKFKKYIDANEKLKNRFQYFNAIALLFENKPETAFQLLTQDISQRPVNEYYYYRMVYAMVFFQLGDIDNALREIENILQSFRFRKDAAIDDKPLVKLIQKLIVADTLRHDTARLKKEILSITNQLEKEKRASKNTSTVIRRWIEWQLQTITTKS